MCRSGLQQEPGNDRFTVERVGRILVELSFRRQSDHFPGDCHHLGALLLAKGIDEQEKVDEIDRAVAVEVEAGVRAAEGVDELEEVDEIRLAVPVEVGRP